MSIIRAVLVFVCGSMLLPIAILMAFSYFQVPFAKGAGFFAHVLGLVLSIEVLNAFTGRPGLWVGSKHSIRYKWGMTGLVVAVACSAAFLAEMPRDRNWGPNSGLWGTLILVFVGASFVAWVLLSRRRDRRSSGIHSAGK